MDAEAELTSCPGRPHGVGPTVPPRRERCRVSEARSTSSRSHLLIQHVDTHVEVLGDVPLGTRADPPGVPVVVAAGSRQAAVPTPVPAIAASRCRAQHGIGGVVVADLSVAAVERRPPTRAPEVLVGRVDVPGSGQLDVASRQASKCAAVDPSMTMPKAALSPSRIAPVAVRGLEDVLQRPWV